MAMSGKIKCKQCSAPVDYQVSATADQLKGAVRPGTFADRGGKIEIICGCKNVVGEVVVKPR